MKYYLCDYTSHRALKEFETSKEVVDYTNASEFSHLFCNMSRYMLAKEGLYPNNKIGNDLLSSDISKKYYIMDESEKEIKLFYE